MSDSDWENHVWTRVPWDRLAALGAVAIAWPLAAIAANDPRRPSRITPQPGDADVDPNGEDPS